MGELPHAKSRNRPVPDDPTIAAALRPRCTIPRYEAWNSIARALNAGADLTAAARIPSLRIEAA